mmetsp:Transcript_7280/g.18316  ORF Transcript_7280/g.18316 Transcript_7280/m.18316 type:complete len:337 (-) Transcript_7280:792-1802(-)
MVLDSVRIQRKLPCQRDDVRPERVGWHGAKLGGCVRGHGAGRSLFERAPECVRACHGSQADFGRDGRPCISRNSVRLQLGRYDLRHDIANSRVELKDLLSGHSGRSEVQTGIKATHLALPNGSVECRTSALRVRSRQERLSPGPGRNSLDPTRRRAPSVARAVHRARRGRLADAGGGALGGGVGDAELQLVRVPGRRDRQGGQHVAALGLAAEKLGVAQSECAPDHGSNDRRARGCREQCRRRGLRQPRICARGHYHSHRRTRIRGDQRRLALRHGWSGRLLPPLREWPVHIPGHQVRRRRVCGQSRHGADGRVHAAAVWDRPALTHGVDRQREYA